MHVFDACPAHDFEGSPWLAGREDGHVQHRAADSGVPEAGLWQQRQHGQMRGGVEADVSHALTADGAWSCSHPEPYLCSRRPGKKTQELPPLDLHRAVRRCSQTAWKLATRP
jgi:hypothetical protein